MNKGILGKKVGMTQIFTEDGTVVPVTVIEAGPCYVVQKKTEETDGYTAIQLGFEKAKRQRVNSPKRGHFARAGVEPTKRLSEFRMADVKGFELGQEIKVDVFSEGELVDVTGTSKGKGFTGVIKRHGFHRGPMTHGSKYHRGPGSHGGSADPSRVFPGRKLPGHAGAERVTVQRLQVARVDPERNLLLIRGAVPGPRGSYVIVRDSIKA